MKRTTVWMGWMAAAALAIAGAQAQAQAQEGLGAGHGAESRNLRLVGMSDLQGRSAFQAVIVKQGERWIAYVGTHGGGAMNSLTGNEEGNGTVILDVTSARQPRIIHHIPTASLKAVEGGEGTGSQMVQVCAGKDLPKGDPAKVYMMRTDGSRAHEMWDVTVPEKPFRWETSSAICARHIARPGNATPASRTSIPA